MQQEDLSFRELNESDIETILVLGKSLNPHKTKEELQIYLMEMFQFSNYYCFGLFVDNKMIGISSGWLTVRFYSGRQLEIDNVIIDNNARSGGFGKSLVKP